LRNSSSANNVNPRKYQKGLAGISVIRGSIFFRQQPPLRRDRNRGGAGIHAELVIDARQVRLDGAFGDAQPDGDLVDLVAITGL